jgi:predicted nucleic acid-binding protein
MLPLRLVLDTNVLISAALKPDGLQRTGLLLALTKPARMYVSDAILAEYREVLGNQRHFPTFWKQTKIITTREFITVAAPSGSEKAKSMKPILSPPRAFSVASILSASVDVNRVENVTWTVAVKDDNNIECQEDAEDTHYHQWDLWFNTQSDANEVADALKTVILDCCSTAGSGKLASADQPAK